jgi:hypothetical protein
MFKPFSSDNIIKAKYPSLLNLLLLLRLSLTGADKIVTRTQERSRISRQNMKKKNLETHSASPHAILSST